MHPLMRTVVLWMAGRAAVYFYLQAYPPNGQFGEPPHVQYVAERRAVVAADGYIREACICGIMLTQWKIIPFELTRICSHNFPVLFLCYWVFLHLKRANRHMMLRTVAPKLKRSGSLAGLPMANIPTFILTKPSNALVDIALNVPSKSPASIRI